MPGQKDVCKPELSGADRSAFFDALHHLTFYLAQMLSVLAAIRAHGSTWVGKYSQAIEKEAPLCFSTLGDTRSRKELVALRRSYIDEMRVLLEGSQPEGECSWLVFHRGRVQLCVCVFLCVEGVCESM